MKDNNQLLKLGLIAMSKSLQIENGFWFHGHIGAEILTNTFYIIEFEIEDELRNAIYSRIEKVINTKKDYFDEEILQIEVKHSLQLIERTLEENISRLSTAGHGVIYGTLILKAVKHLDGWLPTDVHNGLIALLKNTQKDNPKRYYQYNDYQNANIDLSTIPDFETPYSAARYCLLNQNYFENQSIDGESYFFHGNQIHDITHAHALVMLVEMGYEDMSKRGLKELSKQIVLGQSNPSGKEAYQHKGVTINPDNATFWIRDVEDEHHFKLAYSVSYLLKEFSDLDESKILEDVSGHWELLK